MNVRCEGNLIYLSFSFDELNGMEYDEAYQLIEDLTEALKKCPVKEPKEEG